jgi:hypothetical protein
MARKQPTLPVEGDVLDAPIEDQQLTITEEGTAFTKFLAGIGTFVIKARGLEKKAKERLDIARQIQRKPPKTEAEDAKVQVELRAAKLERKVVNDTWGITQVLSKLHKSTVAGRERAGGMLDEAAEITQALHNDYTREEKRKADEREAEKRRIAEAAERRRQDEEAARLEQEALDAEAAMPTLSDREEAFVNGILNRGLSPFEAAKAARFAKPAAEADRLMASKKINEALDARKAAIAAREQATAVRQQPVNVVVERERPAITRVANTHDATTWSAEVFDAEAFMAAVLDPRTRAQLGIPASVATYVQKELNDLARSLHEKMNVWPGVRAKSNTSTRG